jgi:hypothetical protein
MELALLLTMIDEVFQLTTDRFTTNRITLTDFAITIICRSRYDNDVIILFSFWADNYLSWILFNQCLELTTRQDASLKLIVF